MIDLKKIQEEVYQNKINKGFNVKDVNLEFCYIHEELAEAFSAYRKNLPDVGEEIADVCIYLFGLAQILGVDLEGEIVRKIEINKNRQFKMIDGKMTRMDDGKVISVNKN